MALTVEDGSIVENANSYASLATVKAYATARGITLGSDASIEVFILKAMDYIEGKRAEFQGMKVLNTQPLQFPRYYLVIDGFEFPYTEIPKELINAECQLVIEQFNGANILPTTLEPLVKVEKVGPLQTEYAVGANAFFEPNFAAVDLLLMPLLKATSSGFSLKTVRV